MSKAHPWLAMSYTLYVTPPVSRNLAEQREDLHKIDYLVQSLVEDLATLLPPGYKIETTKEKE